ncbi:secreted/surface protein with fasciclin-like repeats [Belliella baltica DSM 15883]|uniref:Secreted/surface protein with fasciclin-like repeats n=1 Tax=Belliella baltica (strain DSM 15883 / CIP 108006 / LMG 21964 / BA134) TaxID=866536 RepID=I3Z2R6_BELBD|nr:fasciclin domain-containing protein [Belliella baltica]AFL83534.1 secreted/surface protein with fasciclin-like repeats [Belliella baltica DSM 15883]
MKKNSLFNWNLKITAVAIALGFGLVSCEEEEPPIVETNTIVDVASGNASFSTLVAAVDRADLVTTLSSPGPFTVFAPTNDAFGEFLTANNLTADQLLANPDLGDILTYHVVSGSVGSSDVAPGRVNTAAGVPFYVSQAPDNSLWINGSAQITQTDIAASNGIIHVLDYVITPPTQNIAEIATGFAGADAPEFTQLVAALVRADLVDAFTGGIDDNLTVFAPTDAAFEALYEALGPDVNGVDDIDLELLTNVLLYHVVPARAFSQDLRQDASLPTLLEGSNLTVDLANLQINDSGLVPSLLNVHATNGVIHVIDQVLLPG